LFASAAFKRGAMEAQDEGSQLLAELAVPSDSKSLVVDYCAGAGGKTLAIAARLANRGRIVATDIDGKKLEELRRRARRAHVSNVQAIEIEDGKWPGEPKPERGGPAPTRVIDALRAKGDVVFVDAPCSGIGALRRNPEARWRLRPDDIKSFASRQREIMTAALELAAPGARVVYATCSLLTAENEEVARSLTGVELCPLSDVLGDRAAQLGGEAFTVTPHTHGTDGFYARVMKRA
jgi:16S rRNA (cytosine967-C5)-methyltransferase